METDARVAYEAMVRQTVAEIESRLDDPPGFRELAASAHVSPYHFHRIFQAMVGESPRQLVRRLRLERSARRLRRTSAPVTEIAFEAGYVTHEAFTKSFQAEFGMAPSAFRLDAGGCFAIRSRCSVHVVDGGFTSFRPVDTGGPPVRVEVVELAAQRVAAVRHRGPYWQIGKAFAELMPRAARHGLPPAATVAAYLDDQEVVPEAELRSIAGVVVPVDAEIGDLDEVWLPAGRFLKGEYVGHYSGLPEAWAQLYRQHIPNGGHQLREDICFEIYVTGHDVAPDEMRTDLYAPIA